MFAEKVTSIRFSHLLIQLLLSGVNFLESFSAFCPFTTRRFEPLIVQRLFPDY